MAVISYPLSVVSYELSAVSHRPAAGVGLPICCSGNYSMLCSWVAKGGRMIFDQTLRAHLCWQKIRKEFILTRMALPLWVNAILS